MTTTDYRHRLATSDSCVAQRGQQRPREGTPFCMKSTVLLVFVWARDLMLSTAVARNHRGALTQAGAGIAAFRVQ
jgi:hypothetical protein